MSVAGPQDRPAAPSAWSRWAAGELRPRRLMESFNAAVVLYLLTAIITLSMAALVYSGPLAAQLPQVLGGVLIGAALLVGTVSVFGSCGAAIAPAEDAPSVILALGVASAAAGLAGASPASQFATVSVLVAGSSLAMAAFYALLRSLRLGALVRFMPHPVMGGFLAGTGWLLVVLGGVGLTTSVPLGTGLLEPHVLARWLPSLALGAVMFLVVRRWGHAALLALLCVLATAGFYAVMALLGHSPSALAAQGWLLGPFPEELAWNVVWRPDVLSAVDWQALGQAAPAVAPALLVGAVGLLLNTSALELVVKRDIALDRELLAHGAGNALAGLAGGLMGYTAISLSALSHTLAHGRRLPGLLTALFLVATALLGTDLVARVPRPVMGALLVFIGIALLHEWLVVARRSLPASDFAVVLIIAAVIAIEGFLWGVTVGLVVTAALFIVRYSRVGALRFERSGTAVFSRVHRGALQRERLQAQAERLLLFQLHGYLFFGTASGLLDRVRRRLAHGPAGRGRRYVVLDFERVAGVDSTALLSFTRLAQHAAECDVELVLAGVDERLARSLDAHVALAALRRFADLDHGIEWCEEQLLAAVPEPGGGTLRDELLAQLPQPAHIDALLARTTRRELRSGDVLLRQGEAAQALYFVESGQLSARLARADGAPAVRLQTMRAGSVVGELGLLLGMPRSADVVADTDCVLRAIEPPDWGRIVAQEPEIARTVDALAIRWLGERVVHLTRAVDALQR
jgi:SulP family sulfate permease